MKRRLAWLYCFAWMALIFLMSATPGEVSGEESGFIVALLTAIPKALFGEQAAARIDTAFLEFLVRKAAHMAEYAVLFWLYRRALALSGVRRPALVALGLCAAYAATDEFHQRFVDDRGPSAIDVLIDTAGAAIAWAIWAAFTPSPRRACAASAAPPPEPPAAA